ncbi:uncharacterized protein LOC123554636 [Mercenaria mercenaria]|uniref:uncharacterized protein LOC123554636 n=1 Tax=Mercenaria mercenaria TaxID=6596 RepID=UPI00234F7181|nr:uncharacterized protein LOC123554636 [Mercenaria mercenaria]
MTNLNLTNYNCGVNKGKQPVAKLVGLSTDRKPVPDGMSFKIFWNSHSPSHALSGLKHIHHDGTVYVDQTGFYYIFSQIKIKLTQKNATDHTNDQIVRHSVHLNSHKGNGVTLLEDATSQCDIMTEESEATSIIGGVFKLETGDNVYVATSHPDRLSADLYNSHFSIHSI